jgi:hypothetical protein
MSWFPKGEFKHKWFLTHTLPIWEKYVLPAITLPLDVYLETGTDEGMSLLWAIDHLCGPQSRAVGVDQYLPLRGWLADEISATRQRAVANLSLRYGVTHNNPSTDYLFFGKPGTMLPECQLAAYESTNWLRGGTYGHPADGTVDLYYVDGGHDAWTCLSDLVLGFPLVKDGGLIIVDDADRRYRGGRPQVREAIDAFTSCFDGHFDVLYWHQRQVGFRKRTHRRGRGQYPPVLASAPAIPPRE